MFNLVNKRGIIGKHIKGSTYNCQSNGQTKYNFKTNYRFNEHVRLSLALDNVFNEVAYVNHPYPQRTAFVEAALDF